MKIVATSDTHFPFSADKIPDGDVFIHAGDLMYSGYPDEWYARLASLEALPHKTKLYVPGNHDFHVCNYRGVAKAELRKTAGVTLLDDLSPAVEIDGVKYLGIPFVTGLPGWAYNVEEDWLEEWLEFNGSWRPDVIISHAPIYRVLDAINPGAQAQAGRNHVGCLAFNKWLHKTDNPPKYWVHGHIHESYGQAIPRKGVQVLNVAMCDRRYEQVNKPLEFTLYEP